MSSQKSFYDLFEALSPSGKKKVCNVLMEMLGEAPTSKSSGDLNNDCSSLEVRPTTPPPVIENSKVKRELNSPETPYKGGGRKVVTLRMPANYFARHELKHLTGTESLLT